MLAAPQRPANTTRFVYLEPEAAQEFFVDYGQLDLDFESLELPSEPGLYLNVYTAAEGTPTADGLRLLASWAASQEQLPTEHVITP